MNNVMLVGRLANDVEIKTTDKGKEVINISVAVNRQFKNVDGTYDVDFIDCILWDALAKNMSEYCKKGDTVGVKGRIQTELYEDKEGKKHKNVQVVVEKLTFLSSRKDDSEVRIEEVPETENKNKKNKNN